MGHAQGPYKLLALDMDGTLLDDAKQISEENLRWIYKACDAGVKVVISTGRSIQTAKPYIEQLNLNTPIVTVNGSEVWHNLQTLHHRVILNTDLVANLFELVHDKGFHYWGVSVKGVYNRTDWVDDIFQHEWLKFGVLMADEKDREKLLSIVEPWGTLEITNSDPSNLEFNAKSVSKAAGLQLVCQLLNIDMTEIVAMGDSQNDLSMIRAAGLGVAMGNAQDMVKEAADLVTVSNEEHGVAQIIRDMILKV